MKRQYLFGLLFYFLLSNTAIAQVPKDWQSKEHFLLHSRVYVSGRAAGSIDSGISKISSDASRSAFEKLREILKIRPDENISFAIVDTVESRNGDEVTVYQLIAVTNPMIVNKYQALLSAEERLKRENESKALSQAKERIEKARLRSQSLEDQLSQAEKEEARVNEIERRVTAISKKVRAVQCGLTRSEVHEIFGEPRSQTGCLEYRYDSYGSIWVVYSSGVVSCLVPAGSFSRCMGCSPYNTMKCAN